MAWVSRDINGVVDGIYPLGAVIGVAEEWLEESDPEVIAFLNPPQTALGSPLTMDQFYTMLENEGKLEDVMAAIETVTPTSKKLTCRNQFNNAQQFTWDMTLVQTIMPKSAIYGAGWEAAFEPIWIDAYNTLPPLSA